MISVIVPVYKVEQYIDKCVQSILSQTYENFELILVDDGSPDTCPKICDEYAKKYSKVRVLHKKNGGLSDARNFGVEHANGEFVTFVDSDDYVSDDYLEILVYLKEKYSADIVVTGILTFSRNVGNNKEKNIKEYCYTGIEALEKMLYQDTLDTSACAMLLPVYLAKKYPFPVGKYHEDEFTTYKYYSSVEKVAVTTKKQYFYLQREGSIMHVFGQSSFDELDAADNLVEHFEHTSKALYKASISKKFSDYCQVLIKCPEMKQTDIDTYIRIIKFLKENAGNVLFDKKTRVKNKIAALAIKMSGARGLLCLNRIKVNLSAFNDGV